jgi:hypothetical protein
MSNTVEYVAKEMQHGPFSASASVMVNGRFFGLVYPTGLSYHYMERYAQQQQPVVGFSFDASGEIVNVDFRRTACAHSIQAIADMLPPF